MRSRSRRLTCLALLLSIGHAATAETHRLLLLINDASGNPLPCRIHLRGEDGSWVRAGDLPFFRDHFVCGGSAQVDLSPGKYLYMIQRGPEYSEETGEIQLDRATTVTSTLNRISEVREQGWYSADLHVHRPVDQIEPLMLAEDLDFAPVITWWNKRNAWEGRDQPLEVLKQFDGHRLYTLMAGEDEREGGALLLFRMHRPIDIATDNREFPSPLAFVDQAQQADPKVAIDIEKPFWWDVPTWLASGKVQSIGLANNHMWRTGMLPNEAWGKPRDKATLPDPLGNALWTQHIYYQILEAGLRIPPSAGSASGVLPNPVGYNRVYVHLENGLEHDAWWKGLHAGQSFVTNGPMLICRANGHLPGHVLSAQDARQIDLRIELSGRDRIHHVDIVSNGQVVKQLACADRRHQELSTTFQQAESGWFLVRAIAENEETFRFASTSPFYVEVDGRPRVTRSALRFFQDWVTERIGRVRQNLTDPVELDEVLKYHLQARQFWSARERLATTD